MGPRHVAHMPCSIRGDSFIIEINKSVRYNTIFIPRPIRNKAGDACQLWPDFGLVFTKPYVYTVLFVYVPSVFFQAYRFPIRPS